MSTGAVTELGHERGLGGIGLGHHQQAGGIAVEPVHDPGPADSGHGAERLATSRGSAQQGMHQGPGRMACRRMDHHPRRLVHDQQVIVLVHDLERDVLGHEGGIRRRGQGDPQELAPGQAVARPARPPVDQRPTVPQQPLRVGPRDARHRGHGHVDPSGGGGAFQDPLPAHDHAARVVARRSR